MTPEELERAARAAAGMVPQSSVNVQFTVADLFAVLAMGAGQIVSARTAVECGNPLPDFKALAMLCKRMAVIADMMAQTQSPIQRV